MKDSVFNRALLISAVSVITIIGILVTVLVVQAVGTDGTQCIGGYKHTQGTYYSGPRQIMDDKGHGIPCNSERK